VETQPAKDARELISRVGGVQPIDWTILRVHGRDAGTFLHKMTTNDLSKLPLNGNCECFVTDIRGKTVGHGFVVRVADDGFLFLGSGRQAETLQEHWQRFIITEDVQFTDLAEKMTALAGSLSLVDSPIQDAVLAADVMFCDVPVKMIPINVYGDGATILLATGGDTEKVLTNASLRGAVVNSADAWETLRVETGFPLFGVDVSDGNLPQEVNRTTSAISFQKGCYLGQETVARIDAMGHVNWYLVGVGTKVMLSPSSEAHFEGKLVARIGSVVCSPRTNETLALAYVRRGSEQPGSRIQTDVGELEVFSLPLDVPID